MSKATVGYALPKGFRLKSGERTYEIVKVLGAGSFGITYLATSDISVGNILVTAKFAIKEHFISASCFRGNDGASVNTVPAATSDVASSRSDFLTEANRLKKICLKSRNIVSVNETFEANGTAYYVMEYLDGGNPGKSSEEEAILLIREIAGALKHIHDENVLHLDIKPDNIVLKTNEKGETYPVVIDFGISKHFDNKGRPTSSISAKGASSGYAPQEQYAGISVFSPKYDIYALGGVLFYLLTGKNPPDAFNISANQQELKKELEGNVSREVQKAILNAMKPSALERTPTIDRFLEELRGVEFHPVLKFDVSHLDFGKGKNKGKVEVESNVEWNVSSNAPWCKVSKVGEEILISVGANNDKGSRHCEIIIRNSTHNISRSLQINQKGQGTVVLTDNWWERNKKNVLISAAGVAALTGIILACVFIGGNASTNEEQVAELDSVKVEIIDPLEEDSLNESSEIDSDKEVPKQPEKIQEQKENRITPVPAVPEPEIAEPPTLDQMFAQAKTIDDYKYLANKDYSKAYAPLAELYLKANNYNEANQMALKAGQSKTGIEKARQVASILNTLGYYDDRPEEKQRIIQALGEL